VRHLAAAAIALVVSLLAQLATQPQVLGPAQRVADGVLLYRLDDPALLEPPGPIQVQALRLDPSRVTLEAALADDRVPARETVLQIATRRQALAAVNAGFFGPTGDPAGLLKVAGRLVSDTRRPRGAVAIVEDRGATRLVFDRVTVRLILRVADQHVTVAAVDAPPARGRLTLYTPSYRGQTGLPDGGGVEWVVNRGRIVSRRTARPDTPIPEDGFLIAYGGRAPPAALAPLKTGRRVTLAPDFQTALGTPAPLWSSASHIVGGAGLLAVDGRYLTDWADERLAAGFDTLRHPRTVIGVDDGGDIWLVTVDGRRPDVSSGMSFSELQLLGRRLGLVAALNLDGGGSTTMVVRGEIVNRPSDPTGPRPVSDALLVFPRE
jgi:hypothetical protein